MIGTVTGRDENGHIQAEKMLRKKSFRRRVWRFGYPYEPQRWTVWVFYEYLLLAEQGVQPQQPLMQLCNLKYFNMAVQSFLTFPERNHLCSWVDSLCFMYFCHIICGLPLWLSSKESISNAVSTGDPGSILWCRFPGGGHGYPLQYSCLKIPHGQRSLVGYSPQCCKESDTTEVTQQAHITLSVLLCCPYFPFLRPLPACSVTQSCVTLCYPMDCSLSVSSVYGISQARILEWVAIYYLRGSSRSRDRTQSLLSLLHWQADSLPLTPPARM